MRHRLITFVWLAAAAALLVGCEVVGYDNPVSPGTSSSWEHVEAIDPDSGGAIVMVRTRSTSNSFFGRLLSLFGGKPSLAVVCTAEYGKQIRLDWREAVGPPSASRRVLVTVGSDTVSDRVWTLSGSGRRTTLDSPSSLLNELDDAHTASFATVNSGGNTVLLIFNVRGLDVARNWMTCPTSG